MIIILIIIIKIISIIKFIKGIKANVVINNADARSKGITQRVQEFIEENPTHLNLFKTVVHTLADFKKAYASGVGVTELNSKGRAAGEVKQLVSEIKNIKCI
ncbi:MAG TPA: hypothetical protein DD713_00955 [Nitrospiraceae bacterium]|jgi:cellulose biosynthesis protein BcsQ|nr:hypothetical protein [Nitrospiraceae bacterium]